MTGTSRLPRGRASTALVPPVRAARKAPATLRDRTQPSPTQRLIQREPIRATDARVPDRALLVARIQSRGPALGSIDVRRAGTWQITKAMRNHLW